MLQDVNMREFSKSKLNRFVRGLPEPAIVAPSTVLHFSVPWSAGLHEAEVWCL
jgi:hypothetical protein